MKSTISDPRANGVLRHKLPPESERPWYRRRAVWIIVGAVLAMLFVAGAARFAPRGGSTEPEAAPTVELVPTALIAHGVVEPARSARVRNQAGGVLQTLAVSIGDDVQDKQLLAVVQGPAGAEMLVAPFAGTVTDVPVHPGDTLLPGATIASVGTLRDYQVATTDVDQYLAARVRPGQNVRIDIDALDHPGLTGTVRSVALEPTTSTSGVQNYAVTVALPGAPPDVRSGMFARLAFNP